MIILYDWDKIGDGYRMVLKMGANDSVDDLPSANRPMNPEFFAVSKEYGIPAEGSVVIINDGDTLIYKGGEWASALPPMPVKGDLINLLDVAYKFRVLSANGSVCKLRCVEIVAKDISRNTKDYAGSKQDIYCNETFYGSLPDSIQKSIIETTIAPEYWVPSVFNSSIDEDSYEVKYQAKELYRGSPRPVEWGKVRDDKWGYDAKHDPIVRRCYAMGMQDIVDYLELTPDMTQDNTTASPEAQCLLLYNKPELDAVDDYGIRERFRDYAGIGSGWFADGCVGGKDQTGVADIYPVFQIDLSTIAWSKIED